MSGIVSTISDWFSQITMTAERPADPLAATAAAVNTLRPVSPNECREIVPHQSMEKYAAYEPCSDSYSENLGQAPLFADPNQLAKLQGRELRVVYFKPGQS